MAAKKHVSGPSAGVMDMIHAEDEKESKEMQQKAEDVAAAFPELVKAANELADVSDKVDHLEDELKTLKARKDHLRKGIIPDLMRKAGIVDSKNKGSFTIPGRKVYLETRVNASVTEENRPSFFKWLKAHKFGDMIKPTVHSSTLTSWVKLMREDGKVIPPTVSVFEETVAKVMKKA